MARGWKSTDPYPHNVTFGELLDWHLTVWGTNPRAGTTTPDRPWVLRNFAAAVHTGLPEGKDEASPERKLWNWRNGANLPDPKEEPRIIGVLFGDSPELAGWKRDLLEALYRGREEQLERRFKRKKPVAAIVGSPGSSPSRETDKSGLKKSALLFKEAGNFQGEGEAWICAGDIAMQLHQYAEADGLYINALNAFGKLECADGQAKAYFGIGNAAFERNYFDAAKKAYKDAFDLFVRVWDRSGQSDCYYKLALIGVIEENNPLKGRTERDYSGAQYNISEAISLKADTGDLAGEAEAICCLAYIHYLKGNIRRSIESNEEAALKFQEIGLIEREQDCRDVIAKLNRKLGSNE